MKNQNPVIAAILAKAQARLDAERAAFEPMSYLKENRTWLIEKIMETHKAKSVVISCMEAVKNFVLECETEDEVLAKLNDIIILHNFNAAALSDRNAQRLEDRKRTVFYN